MQFDWRPPHAAGALKYRPDIDGLRAIAIALVVLYHLEVRFARGGFVGVDCFFVISGFLICRIVAREAQAGTFSFVHFYERRIRRIFPALFAMFAASTAAGFLLLLPGALLGFGKAMLAATFFLANFHFLGASSYFTLVTDPVPLIHTWSLAAEEQFYLIFPMGLWLSLKIGRKVAVQVLWATAGLSLAASILLLRPQPDVTFYLLPTRAWEMLLGSLLALDAVPALTGKKYLREALALLGLGAILAAGGIYSHKTPFPGASALIPCIGAALIIHTGRTGDTLVFRILSARPLVFLGLISYSLYLWHKPVADFAIIWLDGHLTNFVKAALAGASVAIAALSWRYVEMPFRNGTLLVRPRALFAGAAVAMSLSALVAGSIVSSHGWPGRLPPDVLKLASFTYDPGPASRVGICFTDGPVGLAGSIDAAKCLAIDSDRKNILVFGDSHAAHLVSGLALAYPEIHFLQATSAGCKPQRTTSMTALCRQMIDGMLDRFLPATALDGIILSANWQKGDVVNVLAILPFLKKSTSNILLFGPIVTYYRDLPKVMAQALWRQDPGAVLRSRVPKRSGLDAEMAAELAATGIEYVSVYKSLCPETGCVVSDTSGDPIQYDYGHLTQQGSAELATRLRKGGLELWPAGVRALLNR